MSNTDIRLAAFDWLARQAEVHRDVLPSTLLRHGFVFRDERVHLLSQKGIFKPRMMELPLSICTTSSGPYDDSFDADGLLSYAYRGTDPAHVDNRGLREAMLRKVPLVYFHRILTGPARYVAGWPAYVVGDAPAELRFTVAVDDRRFVPSLDGRPPAAPEYTTSLFHRRLHQQAFRERVLEAYRRQCAFCRLQHAELLDAAHIRPDAEGGEATVRNGLSLCKLHHAAFDRHFVSVEPSRFIIRVRPSILRECDGPMLRHGLQALDGQRIRLPRRPGSRPDRSLLAERYARFREATVPPVWPGVD